VIVFRHADPRFPFLWEDSSQPPARWHGEGEGPVHYFADTPYGAWAELLRHEEIRAEEDLAGVRRALWAVELPDLPVDVPALPKEALTGDPDTYPACREEARRLRRAGSMALRAPSAALLPGGARGWRVEGGLREAPPRDGEVYALFGRRPDLVGWAAVTEGAPPAHLLPRIRHWGTP
jgi:RES domain